MDSIKKDRKLPYEPPKIYELEVDMTQAMGYSLGACDNGNHAGSGGGEKCKNGNWAGSGTRNCNNGNKATSDCYNGNSAGSSCTTGNSRKC